MFVEHCPKKRGNARKTRTNWRKPYREWYERRGVRRPAGEEEGGRRRKMKRGFIMKGAEEERRRMGRESQTARPERKV